MAILAVSMNPFYHLRNTQAKGKLFHHWWGEDEDVFALLPSHKGKKESCWLTWFWSNEAGPIQDVIVASQNQMYTAPIISHTKVVIVSLSANPRFFGAANLRANHKKPATSQKQDETFHYCRIMRWLQWWKCCESAGKRKKNKQTISMCYDKIKMFKGKRSIK